MPAHKTKRRLLRMLAALLLFVLAMGFLVRFMQVRLAFLSGMLLLGISLLMPLRDEEEPWDLLWDTAGWIASLFIGLILGTYFRDPVVRFIRSFDSIAEYHRRLLEMPDWVLLLIFLLLMDFLCYWAHRALHSDKLWSQHAWHHSPRYLNWLSGTRTTFVNYLILTITPAIVVGILYPMPRAREAVMIILAVPRLADHLHHTNMWLPWARYLEYLIVTPRFHFVHHHRERRFNDSNFGFLFSFWDRLFGTYSDPETLEPNFPLGLNYDNENWRLLLGLGPVRERDKMQPVAERQSLD